MLTPENFRCDRSCADCCIYLSVKLYKHDIESIKRAGYDEFMEYDTNIKSPVLKMTGNGCIFLGKKGGKYCCKIYRIRPKVCRLYPFVNKKEIESCKPALLKYKFNKAE